MMFGPWTRWDSVMTHEHICAAITFPDHVVRHISMLGCSSFFSHSSGSMARLRDVRCRAGAQPN
jgi:hypothetical protein